MDYTIDELEQMQKAEREAARRRFDPTYGKYGTGQALASLKHGGKIKETGLYKLHKGETVIPARSSAALTQRDEAHQQRQARSAKRAKSPGY